MPQSLYEKPYFQSPGISWKVQKDQVSIVFPLTFWLKKDRISHHRKVQSKNFLVISKYGLFINFLAQKKTAFPSPKSSKQENHFKYKKNVKLNEGTIFLSFFSGYYMIYHNVRGIRDPLKQDLALEF